MLNILVYKKYHYRYKIYNDTLKKFVLKYMKIFFIINNIKRSLY